MTKWLVITLALLVLCLLTACWCDWDSPYPADLPQQHRPNNVCPYAFIECTPEPQP